MILNGNVIPKDMPMYRAGFTSGKAWRNTAGTAMYEALAARTINRIDSPRGKPISVAKVSAKEACISGAHKA